MKEITAGTSGKLVRWFEGEPVMLPDRPSLGNQLALRECLSDNMKYGGIASIVTLIPTSLVPLTLVRSP